MQTLSVDGTLDAPLVLPEDDADLLLIWPRPLQIRSVDAGPDDSSVSHSAAPSAELLRRGMHDNANHGAGSRAVVPSDEPSMRDRPILPLPPPLPMPHDMPTMSEHTETGDDGQCGVPVNSSQMTESELDDLLGTTDGSAVGSGWSPPFTRPEPLSEACAGIATSNAGGAVVEQRSAKVDWRALAEEQKALVAQQKAGAHKRAPRSNPASPGRGPQLFLNGTLSNNPSSNSSVPVPNSPLGSTALSMAGENSPRSSQAMTGSYGQVGAPLHDQHDVVPHVQAWQTDANGSDAGGAMKEYDGGVGCMSNMSAGIGGCGGMGGNGAGGGAGGRGTVPDTQRPFAFRGEEAVLSQHSFVPLFSV